MNLKKNNQEGGLFVDDRGIIRFINEFPQGIKRMYQVGNLRAGRVRAWHGHLFESKYVYVPRGIVEVKIVPISHVEEYPGMSLCQAEEQLRENIETFILSAMKPSLLHIPAGYYNGFKTLTDDAMVQFFSTSTLEESKGDDYRLPPNYFGEDIWKEKDR